MRDAVLESVLEQRLQQQCLHPGVATVVVDLLPVVEAIAEADALDVEVGRAEAQLLGERDRVVVAEPQAGAQELAQAYDGVPRRRRIRSAQ